MMPSIQYARTEDDVSIAYWTLGTGSPIIADVGQWSHTQREWDIADRAAWFERQAENHTLIRFDHRGTGLSDRHVDDFSLEAFGRDIDAVMQHVGIEQTALLALGTGHRPLVAYAASHPEQVSQLILWHTTFLGEQPLSLQALTQIRDTDWEFYTDALVLWVQGWTSGEASAQISSMFRDAVTPEVARAIQEAQDVDVGPLLEQLTMPTLLLYRPGARDYSEDMPRSIASRIPHARSVFFDGSTYAWYLPDSERFVSTIDEFIAEHSPQPEPEPEAQPDAVRAQELVSDTQIVLFTDIEGSSALASRYGDDHAHEVRRAHDKIVREALKERRGKEIKHTGDGIMAAFGMASQGLDSAIAIQQGVAAYNEEHPKYPLSIYIGLNAGEPIAENEDLFGTSVDLAARICDYADAGTILTSDVVRQLVAGKHYLFADRGHSDIRGMEEPIRLWEVRWQETDA
jgi:class 3 adenylate cyclase